MSQRLRDWDAWGGGNCFVCVCTQRTEISFDVETVHFSASRIEMSTESPVRRTGSRPAEKFRALFVI